MAEGDIQRVKFKGFKWTIGDADVPALALVVDNASKLLHICEPADVITDWALAACSHPTVCIHSATNPETEYIKMWHDATDAHIDCVGATALNILIGGTAELELTSSALSPGVTDSSALGTTALMWSDLFLASGAVINFNNGDVTVTHASGSLSVAGSTAGTTLNITSAAPTAANNGIYSLMTSSAAWTGSLAAIRGRNTVTATGAGGNCYGGWFNLLFSSGAPTGLGLSAGLYVEAGSNIATTGVSSVLMATLLGDADGAITNSPILTLADASTLKTKYLMEVGFNAGATTVGTTSGKIYYNNTLCIMVNGADRFIPLSTVEGTYTTAYPIITTRVDPSAAYNGIYTTVTQSATYAGSIAGNRTTVTCSATAAIGNMYGGRFELIQSALPASQGHTCGLYVQVTPSGTGHNPTSVLTLCRAGTSTGTLTPFINILDANTNKTTCLMELGTGNAVGTGTSGTALFETSASITNVNEITAGLRVKVNGSFYYLLMCTEGAIQD